jgi:hypothetical protein
MSYVNGLTLVYKQVVLHPMHGPMKVPAAAPTHLHPCNTNALLHPVINEQSMYFQHAIHIHATVAAATAYCIQPCLLAWLAWFDYTCMAASLPPIKRQHSVMPAPSLVS